MASFQLSAIRNNVDLRSTTLALVALLVQETSLPDDNMKPAFAFEATTSDQRAHQRSSTEDQPVPLSFQAVSNARNLEPRPSFARSILSVTLLLHVCPGSVSKECCSHFAP